MVISYWIDWRMSDQITLKITVEHIKTSSQQHLWKFMEKILHCRRKIWQNSKNFFTGTAFKVPRGISFGVTTKFHLRGFTKLLSLFLPEYQWGLSWDVSRMSSQNFWNRSSRIFSQRFSIVKFLPEFLLEFLLGWLLDRLPWLLQCLLPGFLAEFLLEYL